MPFLDRPGGARIYFEKWGERNDSLPWLTLINGHTRSLTDFRAFARQLVQRRNVLSLDLRGAGKTESPLDFTLEDLAADVEVLWDETACPASHLLGISMGGAVCLEVAKNFPEKLRSLILVSTAASVKDFPKEPQTHDVTELETWLRGYFSQAFVTKNSILAKALAKEAARAFHEPGRAERSRAQKRAIEGVDLRPFLPALRVPTLVIHGGEDPIIPLRAGREMADTIPGARLLVFPNAGHLLLAEMPKPLYDATSEFIDSLE